MTQEKDAKLWIRLCLTVLVALVTMVPAPAEGSGEGEERQAVLAAVEAFFSTMTDCDGEAASEILDPEGRFFRVAVGAEGGRVTHFDNSAYLEGLVDCEHVNVERIWDAEVRIHRGLAVVWAPYDLWSDGDLSHCGVDVFNLVQTEGGWRITGGVYTVEKDGCEPSPLGPPGAAD